jgi:PAS domain S-box-containing protein
MTDKFSLLASIASDWWWQMDAELRFTFLSERFNEVFGLSPAHLIGKRRTDANRTDYGNPAWKSHLDDLANHRPFRDFETTFVDAKGVSRPVSLSGTPLFATDGTFEGYIGVGHDLTGLRRRETEASQQAANLESTLENIEQGVALFDGELRIVAYNRRLAEWLQIGADRDVRGMSYETIVRELAERGEYGSEDKEAAIATRMRLVQSRERFAGERRREDGRIVAVTFNPLPTGGGVMTYTDVTEARNREAQLTQSEENFRYLFQNSPLPKWVYSIETLKFLEVNQAAVSMYGYTREEFLGMTLKDIGPEEDPDPQSADDRLAASTQGRDDHRRRPVSQRHRLRWQIRATFGGHRHHGAQGCGTPDRAHLRDIAGPDSRHRQLRQVRSRESQCDSRAGLQAGRNGGPRWLGVHPSRRPRSCARRYACRTKRTGRREIPSPLFPQGRPPGPARLVGRVVGTGSPLLFHRSRHDRP